MKPQASRADRFYRLSAGLLLLGFAVAVLWIARAARPHWLARISTVRVGWFFLDCFERGPWKSQSVHYQVVLRKNEESFGFSEVLEERPTS